MEHDEKNYWTNYFDNTKTCSNINWTDQYGNVKYDPWTNNDDDDNNYSDLMKRIADTLTDEGEEEMKKCEVCLPDGNGKAQIGRGCFFLCPTHGGFMLYLNPEGVGVEIYCFETFKGVMKFLQENEMMDINDNLVADNI